MKKLFVLAIALALFIPCVATAADIGVQDTITQTVSAGGSYSGTDNASGSYDLKGIDGYMSVQVSVAGSGTLSLTYLMSNDRVTFVEPEIVAEADDTLSGITSADGTVFKTFQPVMGRYFKFEVAETGGASPYTATIIPAIK